MINTETQQSMFANRVSNIPTSFVRDILKVASNPDVISFAGGLPNPAFFPVEELQDCTVKAFRDGKQMLQYAATEGYYPLRQYLSEMYRQSHGLNIIPEQILITNGSQQGLDLLGKLFINPGDHVLMERPTYLGALQSFSVFEPRFKDVTLQPDGIDTNELAIALNNHAFKLFYCIPNFQNPTGIQYSMEKRRKVTDILSNYSTIIVEDDPYGDISFTGDSLPSLYSYLPEQTVWLGSFSKTVAPGLRLGWMVASKEIIQKVVILKQASDLHSGNLSQYILSEFLSNYNPGQHINKIRNTYRMQRDIMMHCLNAYFPADVSFTEPQGGMFTWLTLPPYITSRQLLDKALKEKIIFVPGDTFYAGVPDKHTLRLNFTNVDPERMERAMKILGSLISA